MDSVRPTSYGRFSLFHFCLVLALVRVFVCQAQLQIDQQTVSGVFRAIRNNDTNLLHALYLKNTNCVADDYYGPHHLRRYPLLQAAADGRTAIVAMLLEFGASPTVTGDTHNSSGMRKTALDLAAQYGHLEICEMLLQAGADPNQRVSSRKTALHYLLSASYGYHTNRDQIAGLLLDYGADPFCPAGYNRDTPIAMDIRRGDGKLVARMLGQDSQRPLGAKLARQASHSGQSTERAASTKEFLTQHGTELLMAAARRGALEAVQALLRAGVDIMQANTNCPTILQSYSLAANEVANNLPRTIEQWHQAQEALKADYIPRADPGVVASRHSKEASLANLVEMMSPERWNKLLQLLIEHGADYDVFAATALGDTNQINHLLAADEGHLLERDCSGQTPLHWSVQADRLPMASFWITAGVPLDATNHAGQTALHLAAEAGKVAFVKRLLAAQSPTHIRDTNGWTALDVAIENKAADCIHLLLPRTAGFHADRGLSTPLHRAAAEGNLAALAALVETQPDLEARDELGLTPLQVALHNGHLAAAALLVDQGSDVNARDPKGNTMLLRTLSRHSRFHVRDRPPIDWLDRMGNDPRKADYQKHLTVGRYEQGPHAILQTVSFLLACGIDVAATNNAGQTAIQLAMDEATVLFNEREPLLKLLRNAGTNIDAPDAEGNTALHRAADAVDTHQQEALAAIIAAGADVNATNFAGRTPLHLAAERIWTWSENPDYAGGSFQSLIRAKANVNARDNEGLTPLGVLATADTSFKPQATRALLDAGADPNSRDKQGRTAAHLFLSGEWPWRDADSCLRLLVMAGADLNAKDADGKTPLHYLAGLGDKKPMFFMRGLEEILATAKVDFNAQDKDGDTPLHTAARTGTRDVFDWLIKQGADLDATNHAGETPRMIAARSATRSFPFAPPDAQTDIFTATREGNLNALDILLKTAPDLANATNRFGQSPLRIAVTAHRTNLVQFLEQHGARWDAVTAVLARNSQALRQILVNQPTEVGTKHRGSSLLHLAAAAGDLESVELLLAAKADAQVCDRRGLSPLGVARLNEHKDAELLLQQHGATGNIFDAAYTGDYDTAAALIRRDSSLATATNSTGRSLLAIASGTGHLQILELLLSNGALADERDGRDGYTPLHVATIYNQTNTANALIEHGAKVEIPDRSGFSPLHLAALWGANEMVTLLMQNQVDIQHPTRKPPSNHSPRAAMPGGPGALRLSGESALHMASVMCEINTVQLLLEAGALVNAPDGMGRTPLDLAKWVSSPRNTFWIRRSLPTPDPLGIEEPLPPTRLEDPQTRAEAVVSLLENRGGKSGEPKKPTGIPPGRLW